MRRQLHWSKLVVAVVVVLGISFPGLSNCTIIVQPGESIQAAIDAAPEGAVICLTAGAWEENLVIQKGLTLRGEGRESTAIKGTRPSAPVIRTESEKVVEVIIEGLTVADAVRSPWHFPTAAIGVYVVGEVQLLFVDSASVGSEGTGVYVAGTAEVLIQGSTVAHNGTGISVWESARVMLLGSSVEDNRLGIYAGHSATLALRDSIIRGHRSESGIRIEDSAQATLVDSIVRENGTGVWMGGSSQAVLQGMAVEDNLREGISAGRYATAMIEDSALERNGWNGISVSGSAEVTIQGTIIRNNQGYGVVLWERPCFDTDSVFTGHVTGRENTGGGNAKGNTCPEALAFLLTEEGGELDRREE